MNTTHDVSSIRALAVAVLRRAFVDMHGAELCDCGCAQPVAACAGDFLTGPELPFWAERAGMDPAAIREWAHEHRDRESGDVSALRHRTAQSAFADAERRVRQAEADRAGAAADEGGDW